MSKPNDDDIPVSRLSYNTVYINYDGLDGKGQVLYLNTQCILVGLNDAPWMLFVTADFNQDEIINAIGDDLYEIKRLVVQSTFMTGNKNSKVVFHIPDWLLAFKKLEMLKFEQIIVDELWLFRNLSIGELILKKVKYEDEDILADSILQFKQLSAMIYDDSLSPAIIDKISLAKPALKLTFEA